MNCLVVDDNKDITEATVIFLDSIDVSSKVINDGKVALNDILNNHYDLVLLDLAIPEFSGYNIIDELEKQNKLKTENIVIITASTLRDNEKNNLLERGIKDLLQKPTSFETLGEIVKKYKPN